MTGTLSLLGRSTDATRAWDFTCACGLGYRVALVASRPQFWPRCGNGFSRTALPAGAPCLRCRRELSLNGQGFR
jgi:hypothetical protein